MNHHKRISTNMSHIGEELIQHLEDILLSDLAIEQARILDIAHPSSSHQDLVVAVSLSDLVEQSSDAAMRHVRSQLIASVARLGSGGSLVPRKWATLPELPVDASGEVDDKALRQVLLSRRSQTIAVSKKEGTDSVPELLSRPKAHRSNTATTPKHTSRGFCLDIPLPERRGSAVSVIEVAV